MGSSWIKNTGKKPEGLKDGEMIEVVWSDGDRIRYEVGDVLNSSWTIHEDLVNITHWRRCSTLSLDDAWDVPPQEEDVSFAEGKHNPPQEGDVPEPAVWQNKYPNLQYPETNFVPVFPKEPSKASRISQAMLIIYNQDVPESVVRRIMDIEKMLDN